MKFIAICGLISLLGTAIAYAVTPPYQLITPTGTASTDTPAINNALSTCVTGQAIFILPGSLALNATLNLHGHDGCSIASTIVGTFWDSTSGTENTTIDCSGVTGPCITMGNSEVLRGFAINGNGSNNCLDLSTNTASGNLFLDLYLQNCSTGIDIEPATCCSQNNRVFNIYVLGGPIAQYCGANCQFNQFSDVEDEGSVVGMECRTGCNTNQFNQFRTEDNALVYWADGNDDVMTNMLGSRIACMTPGGNNLVTVGVRCAGVEPGTFQHCIGWNDNGTVETNVIIRDFNCSYYYTSDNAQQGSTAVVCNNCLLDYQGSWCSSCDSPNTPTYDSVATEAALDWQRPQKMYFLQAYNYLSASTTSAAPDFKWSPNASFSLSSSCPCTITNPVYAHDGQNGFLAVAQDSLGGRTISTWGSQYTVTTGATLDSSYESTTYFPYTVSGTQIILGNSYSSGSPTNLLTGGNNFATGWTASPSGSLVITTGQTDPLSGTTAASAIENSNATATTHEITQNITLDNSTYTCSVYYKADAGSRDIILTVVGSTGNTYLFADTGGGVPLNGSGGTATGVNEYTNSIGSGWYQAVITAANYGVGSTQVGVSLANPTGPVASYPGNGTSGLFIWRPACIFGPNP
jgi:hypothetical protein